MNSNIAKTWFCAVAAGAGLSATAADVVLQAREILNHSQNSVINISAMSKLDMGGSGMPMNIGGLGEAQETQCAGTVIDASGLTAVSYSAVNPFEKISKALKVSMDGMGDADNAFKSKTELNRIRMHLSDGSEVTARLVLKDKELDLAFLLPDPQEGEKMPQFTPVKLSSPAAQELDDVVILTRHNKELGYQPIVTTAHVSSVIKQPRPMYDLSAAAQPGSPVFLPDGQLLGLCVSFGGEEGGLMSMSAMQVLVLPAAEIAKVADQAKKAADKKPDEPAKTDKN